MLCKCLHCQVFLVVLGCSSQSRCWVWSSSSSRQQQLASRLPLSPCSGSVALSVQALAKNGRQQGFRSWLKKRKLFPFPCRVASWFAAAVMESCNGVLAAPFRNVIVNDFVLKGGMFTVGAVTGPLPEDKFVFPSGYVCYY